MLNYESLFWREKVFRFVCSAIILFIVLTVAAMFLFPGGTLTDPTT